MRMPPVRGMPRPQIRILPEAQSYFSLFKGALNGWGNAEIGKLIRYREYRGLVAGLAEDVRQIGERIDLVDLT